MLIDESKYRLGEFIILEHSGVLLTWVAHGAMGAQRSGKCSLLDNILVLGPWDHEEPGYLKLEFHEALTKLPAWDKTRYYCFAASIHDVGTGKSLTSDSTARLQSQPRDMEAVYFDAPGTFRLGRYEITVDENRIISWQTPGEGNRTIRGTCSIESGILFLESKTDEVKEGGQDRQMFFNRLKQLPPWERTLFWGHYGSLMHCTEPEPKKSAVLWNADPVKTVAIDHGPLLQSRQLGEERMFDAIASTSERFKTAWQHTAQWKVWVGLLLMLMAGIFFVFLFILALAAAGVAQVFSRITSRFRKHFTK